MERTPEVRWRRRRQARRQIFARAANICGLPTPRCRTDFKGATRVPTTSRRINDLARLDHKYLRNFAMPTIFGEMRSRKQTVVHDASVRRAFREPKGPSTVSKCMRYDTRYKQDKVLRCGARPGLFVTGGDT